MRVLHVYRTYFPDPQGGLQEAIRQFALATGCYGVESRVFTLSANPVPEVLQRPEALVVRSRSWAEPASCNLGGISGFRKFAEQANWADVIHYHFPWPFADILNLVTGSNRPGILTYHSDIVRQRLLGKLYQPLMVRTLKSMKAIVATSPAYAETSPALSGLVERERMRMIPNGIVEASYENSLVAAKDINVQKAFDVPVGSYFLFVGVLRYYKGLHILLEAMRELDSLLLIAGDGPERDALEKQARELPPGRVRFLGQVSDAEKMALIRGSRALVLPSHLRSEAFGMVLVEAMMCSKPVISCEIGTGTSYVNQHGVTGLVVAPDSPQALADAMRRMMQDQAFVEYACKAARERYETLFSGPALGQAYAQLYQQVLS